MFTHRPLLRSVSQHSVARITLTVSLALLALSGAPLHAQSFSNKEGATAPLLPELPKDAAAPVVVLMTTNFGEVLLELDAARAPITVRNFLAYAKAGFYNDTAFHRVMRNSSTAIVQGGGYSTAGALKATETPITNEWTNGLKNVRGTIAMARQPDPNSATSQFFFNLIDQPLYDAADPRGSGYCVFGKVIAGLPVLDAISMEKTGSRNASLAAGAPPQALSQWPVRDCIIEKIVVVSTSDVAATTERVKHTQVKDPSAPTVAKPAPPTPPLKAS